MKTKVEGESVGFIDRLRTRTTAVGNGTEAKMSGPKNMERKGEHDEKAMYCIFCFGISILMFS